MTRSKPVALPLGDNPTNMVRKERLELSHLTAPEPKSGASTNSATPAYFFASLIKPSQILYRYHNQMTTTIEMVRKERLELSHLAAPEPKSGASTNSATPASHIVFQRLTDESIN